MASFVIDAYAWIEYFDGSKQGEVVAKIIEDSNNSIYTNIITIAELASHFRRKNYDFADAKKIILSLSTIYNINFEFAEKAGVMHAVIRNDRKHMGIADIFILLTAEKLKAKVVTGDEDFRGLKESFMIK